MEFMPRKTYPVGTAKQRYAQLTRFTPLFASLEKRQLIKVNVTLDEYIHILRNNAQLGMEAIMVEKSHTVGSWPDLYGPLRGIGQTVADWFAPRSEASSVEDCYEIKVELPGVKAEDVDVSIHDNSLTVRGQSELSERRAVATSSFLNVNMDRSSGRFDCLLMHHPTRLKQNSRTVSCA